MLKWRSSCSFFTLRHQLLSRNILQQITKTPCLGPANKSASVLFNDLLKRKLYSPLIGSFFERKKSKIFFVYRSSSAQYFTIASK